jgi:hypothetical protein
MVDMMLPKHNQAALVYSSNLKDIKVWEGDFTTSQNNNAMYI